MLTLFIYLFLALFISFLCSIMEAVLLSTRISYLRVKVEEGTKFAKKIIKLKQNIDRPLSAILSLNTVAHTVGAAGVGAQATIVFGEAYFGIISAILTILILFLSEIIPKTIGTLFWRELTIVSGYAIRATIIITYPLVIISTYITKIISKRKNEETISREEISQLANIGTEEGVFGEKENKIIQNLIRLKNIKVSEIMTPRVVVAVANKDMTLEEFRTKEFFLDFSRIPIYSDNSDNTIGYVLRQTVFENLADNRAGLKLKEIKREIIVVTNNTPIFLLMEQFLKKNEHIALIIDEHGGMEGIVTMEDIIETLLGFEIVDETDKIIDMQQYAREKWKIKQSRSNVLE